MDALLRRPTFYLLGDLAFTKGAQVGAAEPRPEAALVEDVPASERQHLLSLGIFLETQRALLFNASTTCRRAVLADRTAPLRRPASARELGEHLCGAQLGVFLGLRGSSVALEVVRAASQGLLHHLHVQQMHQHLGQTILLLRPAVALQPSHVGAGQAGGAAGGAVGGAWRGCGEAGLEAVRAGVFSPLQSLEARAAQVEVWAFRALPDAPKERRPRAAAIAGDVKMRLW